MWQGVWVETGGTFTDCIAIDTAGEIHRAKVLSSSALRGTVAEALSATRIRVTEHWNAPSDFVRGQRFVLLGREASNDRLGVMIRGVRCAQSFGVGGGIWGRAGGDV